MAIQVIYETHSISVDNEIGLATGWLPGQLSETGRALARELGERHRDDDVAVVFVSDLARAVETAELAFGGSGIPIVQDPRLRECNYGSLNGMAVTRLEAERYRHVENPWPGGQSYRQVVAQMRDFLRDLAAARDAETVVVIAHSANKWALDHLLHGIPLEDLVDAPFNWRPGWLYTLPAGWDGMGSPGEASSQ